MLRLCKRHLTSDAEFRDLSALQGQDSGNARNEGSCMDAVCARMGQLNAAIIYFLGSVQEGPLSRHGRVVFNRWCGYRR
jgi:hypothetical protein